MVKVDIPEPGGPQNPMTNGYSEQVWASLVVFDRIW